jgi:UDP-N-acetylmuramyl pentapeptide phosphotransferase/UDP-N-acetylglucosamine-1-phosphate transferase
LGFCILSLLCAVILGLFDKRAEAIRGRKQRNESGEKIHLKDIREFSGMFWLVVIICVTFYVNIIPFVGIATYVIIIIVLHMAWLARMS